MRCRISHTEIGALHVCTVVASHSRTRTRKRGQIPMDSIDYGFFWGSRIREQRRSTGHRTIFSSAIKSPNFVEGGQIPIDMPSAVRYEVPMVQKVELTHGAPQLQLISEVVHVSVVVQRQTRRSKQPQQPQQQPQQRPQRQRRRQQQQHTTTQHSRRPWLSTSGKLVRLPRCLRGQTQTGCHEAENGRSTEGAVRRHRGRYPSGP